MAFSNEPYILALDHGTQSARAMLIDLRGEIIAKSKVPIEPYFSVKPGWAEQRVEVYWEALAQACRKLWTLTDIPKAAIAGVALTTQRGTVINLDASHQPLRPAMVWLDQRRTLTPPALAWLNRLIFRLSRADDLVWNLQTQAESNWLAQHQPEVWAQTAKLALLSGYLTYRLTGRLADSVGCQVAYLPFDYRRHQWEAAGSWKWRGLSLDPARMVELVPVGAEIARISAEASAQTGIPAGLPLIAAAADKACEVLGSGSYAPHSAAISFGTTATLNITTQRYWEVSRFLPPYPAAIPGAYNVEIQIYRGYWMVEWFRKQFGQHEEHQAAERGIAPEALFDELLAEVPPGADGLILQPYWTPGVRHPGPEAKGAIIGFGDVHTRAHIYRAILEGLAYALRDARETVERRGGLAITELRISGGGSQSDAAMQLTADIFDLPAIRPHTYETSGLGAAMVAAVGLGLHPSYAAAAQAMTRPGKLFAPNPATRELYDRLYRRVYQRMYGRLRSLYADIAAITPG